ncbi:hypothetical protein GCM10020219_092550 [Nonomuraea dietziae]
MSTGGKWVKILVPSMPSHRNVWWGNLLTWLQEIFWVRSRFDPAALTIWGSPAAKPNVSGSHTSSFSMPNSSRKNRLPWTNCLAMASEPGMLVSDSTHMPPVGTNLPAATALTTLAQTSGLCSFTQAHCCACDMAKTKSGSSSSSAVMLEVVRATLRTVSRSGQSQAESMWAWPTALIRWAEGAAGVASIPASSARPAAAVPLTSCRSIASRARSTARSSSQRRAPSTGSSAISSPRTSRSITSCQTVSSKIARSMRASRYCGSVPAVSLSPSFVGTKGW